MPGTCFADGGSTSAEANAPRPDAGGEVRRGLPLGAGVLVEDAADYADLLGLAVLVLEGDDISRVDLGEVPAGPFIGHDEGFSAAIIRADIGFALDAEEAGGLVHRYHAVAVVLESVRDAHRH